MNDETKPLVQNAADRQQVKAAGKRVKRNSERELDEIKTILSTRQGRKWFWRKMVAYKVFSTTFAGDPYRSAFNEGVRSTGLDLLADVNTLEPDVFLLMSKEAKEDSERGYA